MHGYNGIDFILNIELDKDASELWKQKVNKTIEKLGIQKIYDDAHKQEVRKLIQTYYWYNHDFIENLLVKVKLLNKDENQRDEVDNIHSILINNAKKYLYFADLDSEDWGNAPLNKLKSDILDQLKEYEREGMKRGHNNQDETG